MDADFSISPSDLQESGNKVGVEVKAIQEALEEIDAARKSLDGWVSDNKARYEKVIEDAMPKMNEMVEALDSYSKVAVQTGQKALDVEQNISRSFSA